jgi:paraquat-inducible protein B
MGDMTNRVASARERRRALKDAMAELGAAASTPAGMSGWLDDVTKALDSLSDALDRHVEMVEGDDGLLAEIREMAPHLQSEIDQMRADHNVLHAKVDSTRLVVKQAVSGIEGPGAVRREIRSLLTSLGEHREGGADLVYDAYHVDITAAD